MKTIRLSFLFIFTIQQNFAQYHPVSKESTVHFTLHNFGFKVTGQLDPPEGDIRFNPDSMSTSYFNVTIHSQSINTDNESRDAHLKEEDYFDIKNYPLIRFVSEKMIPANKKGDFETLGLLKIKNITKEKTIPFHAVKAGNGWRFTGNFKMNRIEFGIGGSSTISDEVLVELNLLAQ